MKTIIDYIANLPGYFLTSLGIMTFIIVISFFVGQKISKLSFKERPGKTLTFFISFIDFFNQYIKTNVGKQWRYVAPLTLTMAIYVLISNISGIVALDAPTKYTAITFSLSLIAFFIVQSTGIISQGWRHFLGIFQPLPPMAPLNIISEFTPIISMALRLFGNIASGALILTLIYKMTGWFSLIITPAFHLIFDIGFGMIQAMVIVLLTIIFASLKVKEADLDIK